MRPLSLYTFYCPHCGRRLSIRDSIHLKRHGSPLLHCPRCGKASMDPFTREPALTPYHPRRTCQLAFLSAFQSFALSVLSLGIWSLTIADHASTILIPVVIFPVFWLILFLYHKQTRNRTRLKQWQESDQRLRAPAYAKALANYDFDVPPQYLPSDFKRTPSVLPYPAVLIRPPVSLHKYPAPRANAIDCWHPWRD